MENVDTTAIRQIVEDNCTLNADGKLGGRNHFTDDCLFIRPTGNPLDMRGWDAMMNSADVKMVSSALKDIHKIEVHGEMAFVIYTSHSVFNFKGVDNDDIAVFTLVCKKIDGTWKIVHGQRSSGRGPEEPLPSFNFN